MLSLANEGRITITNMVEKMCHNPAIAFNIDRRGFIREGYHADLVLVDPNRSFVVNTDQLLYKCGWSPLQGVRLGATVTHTFVNGRLVFENGHFNEEIKGQRLQFNR
jgi:dihydroorotase